MKSQKSQKSQNPLLIPTVSRSLKSLSPFRGRLRLRLAKRNRVTPLMSLTVLRLRAARVTTAAAEHQLDSGRFEGLRTPIENHKTNEH